MTLILHHEDIPQMGVLLIIWCACAHLDQYNNIYPLHLTASNTMAAVLVIMDDKQYHVYVLWIDTYPRHLTASNTMTAALVIMDDKQYHTMD